MTFSAVMLFLSFLFYDLAFTLHLLSFFSAREGLNRPAFAFMRIGFVMATFYFALEGMEAGFFFPVLNFSQALAFFAWSLAFVYLVLLVRIQTDSFGIVLTPVLVILAGVAFAGKFFIADSVQLPESYRNPYFTVHILGAFFAYASFTLSFAAGVLYLIQNHELKSRHAGRFYQKLPSLEELEKLIYQPLFWGVPLLGSAVAIGFIWSKRSFGEYWLFDPKTLATIFIVGFYLFILMRRTFSELRGKQGAVWSVLAFGLVIVNFVGLRFIVGSHQY